MLQHRDLKNKYLCLISFQNSFCFDNNNYLALVHLPQEAYLPWCTNIQSPPSLCHVLFASQKKVRSATLPMHAMVIQLNVPLKRQLQAEQSLQCCEWLILLMFQTWLESSRRCRT